MQISKGVVVERVVPVTAVAALFLVLIRLLGLLTRPWAYRGLGTASRLLSRVFPPQPVDIHFVNGGVMRVDLLDYYWSRMVLPGVDYEPEIVSFLDKTMSGDFLFIDCGANIGFWSILLAPHVGAGRVVSIEAAPATFSRLDENRRLNGGSFDIFNYAIAAHSGDTVPFFIGTGHAAAHVQLDGAQGRNTVSVETKSVDDLFDDLFPGGSSLPVVIKLDVEGLEIDALKGADKLLSRSDVCVIYECHGADKACSATAHLLADERFDVFAIDSDIRRVASVADALALKTNPRVGYNFAAVRCGSVMSA